MELSAPARNVLAIRAKALAEGDASMVRECEWQLSRWGISLEEALGQPERVVPVAVEQRPARVKPAVVKAKTPVKAK